MIKKLSKGMVLFMLGIFFSQFITPLPSLANIEVPLDSNQPLEQISPGNWIEEKDIIVTNEKITINVQNAKWAKFTNTNSMDPVIDEHSNALQIVPKIDELSIGDIISYKPSNETYLIIHRIIEIGEDEKGWYAYVKGDNNSVKDSGKIRAEQVEKVVIGIIY